MDNERREGFYSERISGITDNSIFIFGHREAVVLAIIDDLFDYIKSPESQADACSLRIKRWLNSVLAKSGSISYVHLQVARVWWDSLSTSLYDQYRNKPVFKAIILTALYDVNPDIESLRLVETSIDIANFVASVARLYSPRTLLDPVCGMGMLLGNVYDALTTKPERVIGISGSSDCIPILESLITCQSLQGYCKYNKRNDSHELFDMIVADPPLKGWRLSDHGLSAVKGLPSRNQSHALVLWACQHLNTKGVALLLVDSTFFSKPYSHKLHILIAENDCNVTASFYIHELHYWKAHKSRRDMYLIVIQKGSNAKRMLAGEYRCDHNHLECLVDNFKNKRNGSLLSQGRLIGLDEFTGYPKLEALDNLSKAVKNNGLSRKSSESIFGFALQKYQFMDTLNESRLDGKISEEKHDNLLQMDYLYYDIKCRKFHVGSMPAGGDVIVIYVKPDVSTPEFLALWFNESPLGFKQLLASRRPDTKSYVLDWSDLCYRSHIFLPTLAQQKTILDARSQLLDHSSIVSNLSNLLLSASIEDSIKATKQVDDIVSASNSISSFDGWCEDLPFPLASILWLYLSQDKGSIKGWETLLNFLEATCQFIACIYLSVLSSNELHWLSQIPKVKQAIAKSGHSITKPSFGTWRIILENVGSYLRPKVFDPDLERQMLDIFGCSEAHVLQCLCAKALPDIFSRACSVRNDYKGHGGRINNDKAARLENTLLELVGELRSAIGSAFRNYRLLRSHSFTLKNKVYKGEVDVVMGSRLPFRKSQVELYSQLEQGSLSLHESGSPYALQMIELVLVGLSDGSDDKTALFFNRWHPREGTARLISYSNPEVLEIFVREHGTIEFLTRLDHVPENT